MFQDHRIIEKQTTEISYIANYLELTENRTGVID